MIKIVLLKNILKKVFFISKKYVSLQHQNNNLKITIMKQVFILIEKSEMKNINGFYDRKEMTQYEADNLNSELTNTIWVLTPNY